LKLQTLQTNYNLQLANPGFPPNFFTIIGEQVKNGDSKKPPMLVVGGNKYLQDNINGTLQSEYHVYLFFYPTSKFVWTVGCFLASKRDVRVYYSCWTESLNVADGFKKCFDFFKENYFTNNMFLQLEDEVTKNDVKLGTWITAWIYRLPKISMKDLLHLENYKFEDYNKGEKHESHNHA
jgi:hypothetical protein